MSFGYDPEAVYQDADIEMMELREEGNRIAALERKGICTHQARVGYRPEPIYPEQEGLKYGQERCRDCKAVLEIDRCDEDGCDRIVFNQVWCETHWAEEYNRRHGRRRT